jgi:hypothetical protein
VSVFFAIALARCRGIVGLVFWGAPWHGFSLFEPGSIASGLGASVFFAVLGSAVGQVGPCEPPSSGGGLTIVRTEAVQVMAGGEIAITPLEKTLSPGKTNPFDLPAVRREKILGLDQGELVLPERQVSLGSDQLRSEAISKTAAAIGCSYAPHRNPTSPQFRQQPLPATISHPAILVQSVAAIDK